MTRLHQSSTTTELEQTHQTEEAPDIWQNTKNIEERRPVLSTHRHCHLQKKFAINVTGCRNISQFKVSVKTMKHVFNPKIKRDQIRAYNTVISNRLWLWNITQFITMTNHTEKLNAHSPQISYQSVFITLVQAFKYHGVRVSMKQFVQQHLKCLWYRMFKQVHHFCI